jgi:hypothetical protein
MSLSSSTIYIMVIFFRTTHLNIFSKWDMYHICINYPIIDLSY